MELNYISCTLVILLTQVFFTTGAPQGTDGRRTLFSEPVRDVPGPEKNYTGIRVSRDSKLIIYYHEQTIAIVEILGAQRTLLNCELLEVKTARDRNATLNSFKQIKKKTKISFSNMMDLMRQCAEIPGPQNDNPNTISGRQFQPLPPNFSSIFKGIFPGTKWCGKGDLADNYFSLGNERSADICCRTHDLCPVKVFAMKTVYNITNYSMVTKSHCACDAAFLDCLKRTQLPLADLIGSLYFNVGELQCVDDVLPENKQKNMEKEFRPNNLRY